MIRTFAERMGLILLAVGAITGAITAFILRDYYYAMFFIAITLFLAITVFFLIREARTFHSVKRQMAKLKEGICYSRYPGSRES